MHLFALQHFSDRFGIDLTVPDFLDAVERSSISATQDMASRLRFNSFDAYATRRDFYFVDRTYHGANANTADFLMSRAFVTGSAVAKYATTPIHIRNGDANSFTLVADVFGDGESDHGFLNSEQGVFSTFGIELEGLWVAIEYSGGLDVNTDSEFDEVPSWLSEAAMAQTALNLSTHIMFQTEDTPSDMRQLRANLTQTYSRYARLHLAAYQPRFTEPSV